MGAAGGNLKSVLWGVAFAMKVTGWSTEAHTGLRSKGFYPAESDVSGRGDHLEKQVWTKRWFMLTVTLYTFGPQIAA